MEPTPRALALVPAAREALDRIQKGMVHSQNFDPLTTTDAFSIALSDVGEIVFLPQLLRAFAEFAPNASLRSVSLPPGTDRARTRSGRRGSRGRLISPISRATISFSNACSHTGSSA